MSSWLTIRTVTGVAGHMLIPNFQRCLRPTLRYRPSRELTFCSARTRPGLSATEIPRPAVTATARHRERQSEEAIHLSLALDCFRWRAMTSQAVLFCGLNLFRNRLHHAANRSCARDRQLNVLDQAFVV